MSKTDIILVSSGVLLLASLVIDIVFGTNRFIDRYGREFVGAFGAAFATTLILKFKR